MGYLISTYSEGFRRVLLAAGAASFLSLAGEVAPTAANPAIIRGQVAVPTGALIAGTKAIITTPEGGGTVNSPYFNHSTSMVGGGFSTLRCREGHSSSHLHRLNCRSKNQHSGPHTAFSEI